MKTLLLDRKIIITWILIVSIFLSCSDYPKEVIESLELSGANRGELEKVLKHYKGNDRKKYEAACFLIANMKYHGGNYKNLDSQYIDFFNLIDSIYTRNFAGMSSTEIRNFSMWVFDSVRIRLAEIYSQLPPLGDSLEYRSDLSFVKADFLIDNIDNAFEAWRNSPYAQNIDWEMFKEQSLPYRTTDEELRFSRSELVKMFKVRIVKDDDVSIRKSIENYKAYTFRTRSFTVLTTPKENVGFYDLYLQEIKNNCHNVTSLTTDILRACGIPTVYEYTPQWQNQLNRHFWCSSPDSTGVFLPFTPPDNNLGEDWTDNISYAGKVYRKLFGANKQSPYFIRDKSEFVPEEFLSPVISDQSFRYHQTITLRLPFNVSTKNKLAYLCFFGRKGNMNPVAWGKIDFQNKEVVFEQVPLNILFFPAYYDNNELELFSDPFILQAPENLDYIDNSLTTNIQKRICDLRLRGNVLCHSKSDKPLPDIHFVRFSIDKQHLTDITVQRKFPEMIFLQKIQERLKSAFILGSNEEKTNFDTLGYLDRTPHTHWMEFQINNHKKYRYYKLDSHERYALHIAELEFIGSFSSSHTCKPPSTLPVLSADQVIPVDSGLYKIIGTPLRSGLNAEKAFDGNIYTSTSASHIGQDFSTPVLVTRVRLLPRNSHNNIVIGNIYVLWYFDKTKWVEHSKVQADRNYILFSNVPTKTLYWLQNITEGREELSFLYYKGKQYFINMKETKEIYSEIFN